MKVIRDPELKCWAFIPDGTFDLVDSTVKANKARPWYSAIRDRAWCGHNFQTWDDMAAFMRKPDEATVEDIRQTMEDFRDEIREIPETIKRKREWNKIGGNVSVTRAIGGNPNFMYRFHRQKHTGPKNITIVFNSDAFCDMDPKRFRWGGIAVAAVTDLLEDAGYMCEIWIEEGGKESFAYKDRECRDSYTVFKVKGSSDTLDLDLLGKVFSPWFLRTAIFGAKVAVPENVDCQSLGAVWPNPDEKYMNKYMDAEIGTIKYRVPFTNSKERAVEVARNLLQQVAQKSENSP